MNKKWLLLVWAGLALQSCGHSESSEEAEKKQAQTEKVLEAFKLQEGQLSSTITIPGELIAFQQVDLYAKVNSFIKKLNADVGSEVRAGQLLVTMEAPEISAQLLGAESRMHAQEAIYLASKANYDRLNEASKTPGTVSQNDLDQAMAKQKSDYAQLDAAKATYKEISDTRNYLEIRAPFSGVISVRNVSAGAYVGPSGKGSELPIFSLQEQRKLRLVVSVPEAYTSYVSQKNKVQFKVKAYPSQTFNASVTRLAGALDTRLRAQRTEMDVINNDRKLLPGMVAEVSIPLGGNKNTFVVPSTAVLNSTLGTFLIKIQDKKTIWVPIRTGRSNDGKTEVFGEITTDDTFVLNATEEIRNGSEAGKVKIN
ncbi:MAG: efflux RND transporter periplasmic adaptor subunit [Siphonobacter sp.]